jgi:hypothetical protein
VKNDANPELVAIAEPAAALQPPQRPRLGDMRVAAGVTTVGEAMRNVGRTFEG